MKTKTLGIALAMIGIISFVFFVYQAMQEPSSETTQDSKIRQHIPEQQSFSLGSLCSSESECQAFCLNNRGLCTSYCDKNPANKLCLTLFDPKAPSPSLSQDKKSNCISNPTLTKITYSNKFYTNLTRSEYRLDMQVSCEVRIAFDHMASVVDFIKERAPTVPANKSSEGNLVSIPVQAGELLGYTSGTIGGRGFDFLIINTAHKNQFINPSRWYTEHSLNKDCQYDYFPENLKQQYMTLIEEEKGVRSCGPRVKEVAGTPQGYWFQGNATETSGSRLAIYESKHFIE